VGGTVDFTDLTSGTPTSWSWTFTGGTPGTETTQHPAGIQYNTAGVYTVSLTASDGTNTDTETKTAYITVGDPPPVANFTANVTTIPVGGSVDFTDLSTGNPTSWAWSFTGGSPTTSTQQNPAGIIYNTAGVYSVSLTASNLNGSDVETKYNYIFVGTNPGDSGCDTLNYPLPGTEVLYSVYFGGGTYGYISGNNGYSDQAKANYFVPGSPYVKLVGGWFKFGKGTKRSSADAEIIFAAWDASGPGGSPGTTPIATDTLLISSIIQQVNTHNLTYIEFNPPINISSPFYLGVFLPEIGGDTLAVLTNKNGETIPGAAWEQWQNGLWYNYSDPVSWGYNLSHAIFPRMCKQDYSVGEGSGLENIIVYPNPADQVVTIDFGNVMYSNISVQLFDVIGQRCGTYMHNGDPLQSFNVDLKDRDAGIYFLRIQAGSDVVSRKITIIK
jgi:PKD repeat protein